MTDLFDLSGEIAVVTGGAGLIGHAICRGLADHGATIVVADLDREAGESLATSIHGRFKCVDVTDEDNVERLITSTVDNLGSIDVLVNAAYPRGENYGQQYEDVTVEDWQTNVNLHLDSYFNVAHKASIAMRSQPNGGSIVNLSSIYGIQAPDFSLYEGLDMTSPVEYAAIKGAITNLTRYMASYLGSEGVRVNAVCPGGVYEQQNQKFVERYERKTPLGRMAEPDDIVGAVVFLASDAAAYVTGHNLVVDGGLMIK